MVANMYKKRIKFYLKIYFKILVQDLKSKMNYRSDFIISLIGMIFTNIVGFISFGILFSKFPTINGWNYYEILFLYGFSLVSLTPVQCFFDNNWNLRKYVYSGDFIKYCFRPINLFFYYQSEVFDIKGIGQLAFGIGVLIYSWGKIGLAVTVILILKLIVYLISASLIMISLQNLSASMCFLVHNSVFLMELTMKMKDYAKYPVTIFNSVFKFIFTFIFPIAFVAYYPSLVVLRANEVPLLSWLSPLVGLIFLYISYKTWLNCAMKYNGTGS